MASIGWGLCHSLTQLWRSCLRTGSSCKGKHWDNFPLAMSAFKSVQSIKPEDESHTELNTPNTSSGSQHKVKHHRSFVRRKEIVHVVRTNKFGFVGLSVLSLSTSIFWLILSESISILTYSQRLLHIELFSQMFELGQSGTDVHKDFILVTRHTFLDMLVYPICWSLPWPEILCLKFFERLSLRRAVVYQQIPKCNPICYLVVGPGNKISSIAVYPPLQVIVRPFSDLDGSIRSTKRIR